MGAAAAEEVVAGQARVIRLPSEINAVQSQIRTVDAHELDCEKSGTRPRLVS